ncbi:MAG: serine hydrolase [Chloracidobacterium sp.]|nr:serine hydrolase [Chloracidobacterium sp.]
MMSFFRIAIAACSITFAVTAVAAQRREIVKPRDYSPPALTHSDELGKLIRTAVARIVDANRPSPVKGTELAVTVIDLTEIANIRWSSYRGDEPIYPASVVKMFYMAALERQLEDKKITMTAELERGLRDMIVDSSNEATQYILDVLTDTSSGAELPQRQFETWQFKRNRVNRWLTSMGYTNINVNQKTFCEDAYGIEQQSRAYKGQNRNMLTTNATARMLAEIVTGRIAKPERTARMMGLLRRDPFAKATDPDSQANGFSGIALIERKMTSAKLWSKAGWTSKARHDAAYIETPDGSRMVVAVYTEDHANERDIIPTIVGTIIDGIVTERR